VNQTATSAAKPRTAAAQRVLGTAFKAQQRQVAQDLVLPSSLTQRLPRPAMQGLAALRGSRRLVVNRRCRSVCRPAAAGSAVPAITGAGGGRKPGAAATRSLSLLRHRKAWHPSYLHSSSRHRSVLPNPSLKLTPNGMAHQPSSAGPAAHCALAVWRAMPPGSA
jgi:hypothetical protein